MKKIFFTLIFLLGFNIYTQQTSAAFKDVTRDHHAYDAIKWAKDSEVVNGFADGTFKPNQRVTEQQFVSILVNFFDLESSTEDLKKYTTKASSSDQNYKALAAHGVPINGYFDNTIREKAVKRGVVAQAIAYTVDGQQTIHHSITFLLDHYISSGQNPAYEQHNLVQFFGAHNSLTRAQVVSLFYRLNQGSFYYISDLALETYENGDNLTLVARANRAKQSIAKSLQLGPIWVAPTKMKGWDGRYSYFYAFGKGDFDQNGRDLTITGSKGKTFSLALETFDGSASGSVEGTATVLSDTKAMMYQAADGNRCLIEFQKVTNAVRVIEHDCAKYRDGETNFSGTLRKK